MTRQEINHLFKAFENLTALVVGDVMIDSYLWGKVDRVSPEAPVPVVHVTEKESRLGGAANVALNVRSLGAKAIICSVVGHGSNGDVFRKSLRENGFSTEGIIDSPERMTTVKTRVISGGHHIVRVDEEITSPLSKTDERNLLECIRLILDKQKIDVIILEDYNKGVLTPKVLRTIIDWANERNIPSAVDPKKDNFMAFKKCTLFKPNFKELKEGLNLELKKDDIPGVVEACKTLQERLDSQQVMVTLSEEGLVIYHSGVHIHIPAHEREIVDVSGAGDTVISVSALCLAAGMKPGLIAYLSNLAGGLVCENTGVVPIDRERLREEAINHLAS